MIDLAGKTAVVFGLANKRSIAWGIAQKLHAAGATLAICYQNERMKLEAEDLIDELPGASGFQCDVSNDQEIEALFAALKEKYGKLDILVHAVAFAPADDLRGEFINTSREGFRIAHRRQRLLAHRRQPRRRAADDRGRQHHDPDLLRRRKSRAQLQRDGASPRPRSNPPCAISPGISDPKNIRVNAISAGPIKTLAARGVGDLSDMLKSHAERAPLHRNVDQLEVGGAGALLSPAISPAPSPARPSTSTAATTSWGSEALPASLPGVFARSGSIARSGLDLGGELALRIDREGEGDAMLLGDFLGELRQGVRGGDGRLQRQRRHRGNGRPASCSWYRPAGVDGGVEAPGVEGQREVVANPRDAVLCCGFLQKRVGASAVGALHVFPLDDGDLGARGRLQWRGVVHLGAEPGAR